MLILTAPPRVRKRSMSRTTSPGQCPRPTRSSTSVRGWMPDATIGASSRSPDSSVTPRTRPPATSTLATAADVRMSAPRARAARATASDTPPMPPCT